MIPTKPPPTFKKPEEWSEPFQRFIRACLVKVCQTLAHAPVFDPHNNDKSTVSLQEPDSRKSAADLLQEDFIKSAADTTLLQVR